MRADNWRRGRKIELPVLLRHLRVGGVNLTRTSIALVVERISILSVYGVVFTMLSFLETPKLFNDLETNKSRIVNRSGAGSSKRSLNDNQSKAIWTHPDRSSEDKMKNGEKICPEIEIEIGEIKGVKVKLINYTPRVKEPDELINDAVELARMARVKNLSDEDLKFIKDSEKYWSDWLFDQSERI